MTITKLGLTGILFVGLFLRFFDLSHLPAGLYWDEMDVGYQASSLITTGKDYFGNALPVFPHSLADYRVPIYTYSSVPFVIILGLQPLSVRLPAAIWSVVGLISFYLLLRFWLKSGILAALGSFSLALSPWHIQYARWASEASSMFAVFVLGSACFFRNRLKTASLLMGISVYTYSPAKFFVPLFLLASIFIYRHSLRRLTVPGIIISLLLLPLVKDFFWGQTQLRFREISVFSDPTLSSRIDYLRFQSQVSTASEVRPGMSPGVLEKMLFNKPLELFQTVWSNYLQSLSTGFLFLTGDPQIRHSPSSSGIGEFLSFEFIAVILGIVYLALNWQKNKRAFLLLTVWIVISPLPSAITRDGGMHASRLMFLLPALTILGALGARYIYDHNRGLLFIYLSSVLISGFLVWGWYFTLYRLESPRHFDWGFSDVISDVLPRRNQYDNIYIDFARDSGLMAYLFTGDLAPSRFQSLHPLKIETLAPEIDSHVFGNLHFLRPGTRNWIDLIRLPAFSGHNLFVASANLPFLDRLSPETNEYYKKITYPDGSPAFYIFSP